MNVTKQIRLAVRTSGLYIKALDIIALLVFVLNWIKAAEEKIDVTQICIWNYGKGSIFFKYTKTVKVANLSMISKTFMRLNIFVFVLRYENVTEYESAWS